MSNNAQAIAELKSLLGDRLSTAESVLNLHGDNETYYDLMPPDAVAFPNNTAEVSEIVKICHAHGCPVIPWGVGTSLEGHALPIRGGVTIDMINMNKLLNVAAEDLYVVVQPGITREELNTELRATGLFFPVDPGANATIGGMTATSASGTTTVRYGKMKDNVMALEVVLADGRIIRTGSRAKKSSAGYDLTRLFVGSEGTLGIITEITLKLHGQPEAISAAVCEFPDTASAVNSVIMAVQMGLPVARMEYVDPMSIKAINAYSHMSMKETHHLFMEFHGSDASVAETADRMKDIAEDMGGGGFQYATKAEDRTKLWHARHNAYFAMKAQKPGTDGISTDVCVPISKLAQAMDDTIADVEAHGWQAPIVGHVGDGNYHVLFLFDRKNESELNLAKELTSRMNLRALELGGTVTGEHGIGIGKMKYLQAEHGEAVNIMADLKRTFDPTGIMNPGKIVNVN
ncbi:FAD-linked oxidase C-terminal domain-containing protein [Amylibacter sp. IMCC11727]|uniref:FAD-binding oxidoreductase n=1 Tax=Amylibacter sp. IMCC11727 TaxID=3039851 RepID=UPI00244E4086|nr:FAD-linked oxidase C-terminal domain-containing protein [Amylibacter sp. IMCC11727]WGI21068.1 FAD-linked oxidase C-terminal domain-containing protein [Amylibacter sp. IMCC11727]